MLRALLVCAGAPAPLNTCNTSIFIFPHSLVLMCGDDLHLLGSAILGGKLDTVYFLIVYFLIALLGCTSPRHINCHLTRAALSQWPLASKEATERSRRRTATPSAAGEATRTTPPRPPRYLGWNPHLNRGKGPTSSTLPKPQPPQHCQNLNFHYSTKAQTSNTLPNPNFQYCTTLPNPNFHYTTKPQTSTTLSADISM